LVGAIGFLYHLSYRFTPAGHRPHFIIIIISSSSSSSKTYYGAPQPVPSSASQHKSKIKKKHKIHKNMKSL